MDKKTIICLLFLVLAAVEATERCYRSCKEIQQHTPHARSGEYTIRTNIGQIRVHCEMNIDGGGFTFIPKCALKRRGLDLRNIFKDKTKVLLQIRYSFRNQKYTVIEPLPSSQQMSVQINSNTQYKGPINKQLGEYIFFGITPIKYAKRKCQQGFKSNGRRIKFKNCDGNPNSYFALFPNFQNKKPSSYHANNLVYESKGVAVKWRKTSRSVNRRSCLPSRYFFFTEIHFGGCGAYTSSDRWRDGAKGVAIGIR